LPPLRERQGDIALLVGHFLQRQNHKKGVSPVRIEAEALAQLERYRWPGNVREVENLIERLVILNEDGVIRVSDLPEYIGEETTAASSEHLALRDLRLPPNGVDLNGFIQTIEDQLILQALSRTGGNKTLAAELLRLNRTTLIERMRKKGLVSQASAVSAISTWEPVRKVTSSEYSLTA
jgi:DNA-binding NtrC family response regulator